MRPNCKFACNNDPLKGLFASNHDPFDVLSASLPVGHVWPGRSEGMIGVDKIGEIRRAFFERELPIKEIVRTLSVSRATVRKVIRGGD